MKCPGPLSAALLLLAGTALGFDTDGGSPSPVTTTSVQVRPAVVLQPRSAVRTSSGGRSASGPVGAMGSTRNPGGYAGPVGAMGSTRNPGGYAGPVGSMGSTRNPGGYAGPVGAMGSTRNPGGYAGPVGAMGSTRNPGGYAGPVGAMGSTRNPGSNSGPVGSMGSTSNRPVTLTPFSGPPRPCPSGSGSQGNSTGISNGVLQGTNDEIDLRLATVHFGYSVRAMKAVVETTEEPFAIFFCSEETSKYTGGGREAYAKYLQSFPGRPTPTTIFDERPSVGALHAAGVQRFVLVTTTPENLDLMRTYGAPPGSETLVVCGFNGDALVTLRGENCVQSQVTGTMKDFPARYKQWRAALQENLERESKVQQPHGGTIIMNWE